MLVTLGPVISAADLIALREAASTLLWQSAVNEDGEDIDGYTRGKG